PRTTQGEPAPSGRTRLGALQRRQPQELQRLPGTPYHSAAESLQHLNRQTLEHHFHGVPGLGAGQESIPGIAADGAQVVDFPHGSQIGFVDSQNMGKLSELLTDLFPEKTSAFQRPPSTTIDDYDVAVAAAQVTQARVLRLVSTRQVPD